MVTINFITMIAPWKNWCRLCANPNGGIPIINPCGGDNYLSERIRRYLSISVLEEDKVSYLLCSKCCEKLSNFDKFVNNCLQVQVMFSTLCELIDDDDVGDDRLYEIRKEFLPSDFEFSKEKSTNNGISTNISPNVKKRVSVGKDLSPSKIKKVDIDTRKDISSSPKLNGCDDKAAQLKESLNSVYKHGRIRPMPELRQAFPDENEILADSLDSDFNEESFENLLENDEAFQRVLRNSGDTGFKTKEEHKLHQSSFASQEQSSRLESVQELASERCFVGEKMEPKFSVNIKQETLKSNGTVPHSELHDLSNNLNTVNSLSDSDMNDFMCDETEEDDTSDHLGGDMDSKELRMRINGAWKTLDDIKPKRSFCKPITEQHHKIYELDEMFVDDRTEEELCEDSDWTLEDMSDKKVKSRNKLKTTFKCDQCDKTFVRKALLDSHSVSHMPKDQQPYVCCKCAKRFHCETLLKNHEKTHLPSEEKQVYPCHVCDKKFSRRSAVTAHTKAIHFGERPFVCHLCGNTFSSKATLQEHITIHSDEEPWECTKCSKKFKTKYRLKIHMDTHRETPYSCPHCPLQLSTRRTLRMHLVVHRDAKNYQCATCGKAFRRAKDLKSHQTLHTGRRPYTCPFCSRTFANGSNCRSHKRRMHPEELRLYEASLAGNSTVELINNSAPLELIVEDTGNLVNQDIDEDANHSMKEDSQDSLLTEMALDLQQPQMLTDKSGLTTVNEDPVVTAADLTLAPLVTLSAALPKLEPDDSRLVVMNLTTQMNDTHDSMEAMSPLNLNIMSPMNLNISSPLNLNISSPLNLNISSVLHSPTGRSQQSHSVQSQHHQNHNRYQQPHQPQQQTHLTLQPMQHPTHQQTSQHQQQLTHQSQVHHQMHQQQVPRSSVQLSTLQTSVNSPTLIHNLSSQTQLPAHINNTVHHAPQIQTFVPLNQQGTLYSHHTTQESVSSAALVAAAAVAHSMATSTSTSLPPFSGNPYVQHSMTYSRGTNM
ncbi:zinc finger protein 41 isoform X2 [Frankliniella occidentalis]|uniref:Zinc finger protein 41 isoform X2 n=1 Tax=Frankliniella occidentalis TaxID=133901 RepID=A0A6J1T8P1_FRAOC|nr:zinc finger protein 41 isoform X2 [Frankliniella occidentalis]